MVHAQVGKGWAWVSDAPPGTHNGPLFSASIIAPLCPGMAAHWITGCSKYRKLSSRKWVPLWGILQPGVGKEPFFYRVYFRSGVG